MEHIIFVSSVSIDEKKIIFLFFQAINIVLDNAIGKMPHDLRPYKLLRTLLDKAEIGSVILDDILFQVFR